MWYVFEVLATCCTLLNVLTRKMWELCIVVDLYHWLYSSPWGDRTNMFSGLKNIWGAEFRNILRNCSEHHLSHAYRLKILYVLCVLTHEHILEWMFWNQMFALVIFLILVTIFFCHCDHHHLHHRHHPACCGEKQYHLTRAPPSWGGNNH